jgi:hypothetical protein
MQPAFVENEQVLSYFRPYAVSKHVIMPRQTVNPSQLFVFDLVFYLLVV